jgi:hypothetical protein
LLRAFEIAARGLQKPDKNILDILADVSRLGEACRIDDAEGNAQDSCERLRKQRFACSRGADEKDVRLLDSTSERLLRAQAVCNADKPQPKDAS